MAHRRKRGNTSTEEEQDEVRKQRRANPVQHLFQRTNYDFLLSQRPSQSQSVKIISNNKNIPVIFTALNSNNQNTSNQQNISVGTENREPEEDIEFEDPEYIEELIEQTDAIEETPAIEPEKTIEETVHEPDQVFQRQSSENSMSTKIFEQLVLLVKIGEQTLELLKMINSSGPKTSNSNEIIAQISTLEELDSLEEKLDDKNLFDSMVILSFYFNKMCKTNFIYFVIQSNKYAEYSSKKRTSKEENGRVRSILDILLTSNLVQSSLCWEKKSGEFFTCIIRFFLPVSLSFSEL